MLYLEYMDFCPRAHDNMPTFVVFIGLVLTFILVKKNFLVLLFCMWTNHNRVPCYWCDWLSYIVICMSDNSIRFVWIRATTGRTCLGSLCENPTTPWSATSSTVMTTLWWAVPHHCISCHISLTLHTLSGLGSLHLCRLSALSITHVCLVQDCFWVDLDHFLMIPDFKRFNTSSFTLINCTCFLLLALCRYVWWHVLVAMCLWHLLVISCMSADGSLTGCWLRQVNEIMTTMQTAFMCAYQKSATQHQACNMCPLHQLHRLCQEVTSKSVCLSPSVRAHALVYTCCMCVRMCVTSDDD